MQKKSFYWMMAAILICGKIQHSGIICTSPGGGSGYRGGIDWNDWDE